MDRIVVNKSICNGKPALRSARITVSTILEFLGQGDSVEEIILAFPKLSEEDIQACIKYAADVLNKQYTIRPVA